MRFLRQSLIVLVFLVVGLAVLVRSIPAAQQMALAIGLPRGFVAFLAPSLADQVAGAPEAGKPGDGFRRGPGGPPLVTVSPVTIGVVNDEIVSLGDGRAAQSVDVTPPVNGVVAEVFVASGQKVAAGEPLIRLVDDAEQLALDKAKVALASAEATLARTENIKTIVSQAELADAVAAAETARLAVRAAEFDLSNRTVRAPIAGVIGLVTLGPGDYVTTATVLMSIDDRSSLVLDFYVPERFAPLIAVGDTVEAHAVARPGDNFQGRVSALDSRIDAASRTLKVEAAIANPDDRLRAGMSFEVVIRLSGDKRPAVDPLSVLWDSQGAYVWRLSGRKAERVAVTIVERNAEKVLVTGDLKDGDPIVREGMQRLRNGMDVRLPGDPPPVAQNPKENKS